MDCHIALLHLRSENYRAKYSKTLNRSQTNHTRRGKNIISQSEGHDRSESGFDFVPGGSSEGLAPSSGIDWRQHQGLFKIFYDIQGVLQQLHERTASHQVTQKAPPNNQNRTKAKARYRVLCHQACPTPSEVPAPPEIVPQSFAEDSQGLRQDRVGYREISGGE